MASEAGVLPIPESEIVQKWRLQPGKMLLVDLEEGRIISDEEIKAQLAKKHPYAKWLKKTQLVLEDLPALQPRKPATNLSLLDRQQCFGYTQEDLQLLMEPMATTGQEAVGSMGTDTPISALSDKSKLLYTYFKQNFAQVTNPPIDSIREELVMSLVSFIGPRPNLFDLEGLREEEAARSAPADPHQRGPGEDPLDRRMSRSSSTRKTLDITYPAEQGAAGMKDALASAVRARRGRRARRLQHHHPVRPPRRARTASRSRRCSRPRPCTITSSARACAPRSASWSRPARRARCITSAASRATARRRSIPISPSRR